VVVLAPRCVDPFNPKVLRSGMGAHFRIPMVRRSWAEIASDYAELPLYLADAGGVMPYYRVDWTQPSALIVGGEAQGASAEGRALAAKRVRIPMQRDSESLNAAVAGSVILFEAAHQRRLNIKT